MVDIAVQLYTLRGVGESLPELLDRVGAIGYDGVEFAYRVRDEPVTDVLDALERNDLDVASAHVPIETLEDDYERTIRRYDRLDVDTIVVPWLDPERFETLAAVDAVADRLNALVDRLVDDGFRLAYHNHDQEFTVLNGGSTAMTELLDRTDDRLGLEIDLGWAAVGGVDPATVIDRHADRITHVHLADADIDREMSVALGEGDVDLDACLASAERAGTEWLVYEHDEPDDPYGSIELAEATLDDRL